MDFFVFQTNLIPFIIIFSLIAFDALLAFLTDFIAFYVIFEAATKVRLNKTIKKCKCTCYFEIVTDTNTLSYTRAGLHESYICDVKNLLMEYHPSVKYYELIMDGIEAPNVKSTPIWLLLCCKHWVGITSIHQSIQLQHFIFSRKKKTCIVTLCMLT